MRPAAETAVIDLELSLPLCDRHGLEGCADALVLLRLRGEPVAFLRVPVTGGHLAADVVARRIISEHAGAVAAATAAGLSAMERHALKYAPFRDVFSAASRRAQRISSIRGACSARWRGSRNRQ